MQGKRPDELDGYIGVKVEPSKEVKYGVFVEVNDHYQLKSPSDNSEGTNKVSDILVKQWSQSMESSLKIAQRIATLGSLE